MTGPRVLHLTRDFPPRVNGGISIAVGGIVAATQDLGANVAVLSFDAWRPRSRARGSAVSAVDGVMRLRGPADLEAAQRFTDRFGPDLVHVHAGLLFGSITCPAPRVFSVHVGQRRQRLLRSLDRPTKSEVAQARAIANSAVVITPSRCVQAEVRASAPRADVRWVPLGVEPRPRAPGGSELLYVGRLADIKGTAELFAAMRQVDAELLVAGGLPDNPRAQSRWQAQAPNNVRFLGWLDRVALERRFQSARMIVAPSWHETFGLAVAEAMSHGVPAIVSDAGALPERVTHEQSGLIVPARDPRALAAAITRLATDDDLHERLATGALAAAKAWAWPACGRALMRIYREFEPGRSDGI
ncbi:MAG TPA: glycosyltransferase family 1 protein [Polyangiaceae bacterium]|nr:glycosyltransferase family 1 protein [Polyangiaceae bacterium]